MVARFSSAQNACDVRHRPQQHRDFIVAVTKHGRDILQMGFVDIVIGDVDVPEPSRYELGRGGLV
jgi:hypothetical protein